MFLPFLFFSVIGMCWLWRVMLAAQPESKGSFLSRPGVWVSGWHHLLPASWWLLGLLSISKRNAQDLTFTHFYTHSHRVLPKTIEKAMGRFVGYENNCCRPKYKANRSLSSSLFDAFSCWCRHSSISGHWHPHCESVFLCYLLETVYNIELCCDCQKLFSFLCRRCVVKISVTVVQREQSVILLTQSVFPPHWSPSPWWRNCLPEGGEMSQVGKSSR